MAKSAFQSLAVVVVLMLAALPRAFSIETVGQLDIDKYLGRWYQVYSNEITNQFFFNSTSCVAADYGLDEASGNITVINSGRNSPTGDLGTIEGFAFQPDINEPGKLKVQLEGVPFASDYWIIGLGPSLFGPDYLYDWAIVSGPEAVTLFVLARDVGNFEEYYENDVLSTISSLGFQGPQVGPIPIVQKSCLPFNATTTTEDSASDSGDSSSSRFPED